MVLQRKTNFQALGYRKGKKLYLCAEEAIYLMDSARLLLFRLGTAHDSSRPADGFMYRLLLLLDSGPMKLVYMKVMPFKECCCIPQLGLLVVLNRYPTQNSCA